MDLISHGLVGTMMAGLGLNKKFGLISTVTMVIANIAPDLDVITFLKGPKTFYKYHREVTHSILGAVILWFLISGGIYLFTPFDNLPAIVAMVGGGLLGHLLLDSLTPWGLPLFYPLTSKKYGFDLIWFFDPVLIGSMVGGVYLAYQYPHLEQVIYISSFALIGSYLALRVSQKRKAVKLAREEVTPRFKDAEVHILPSAVSPFMWDVIFTSRGQYLYISVDSRREEIIAVKEFTSSGYHRCVKCSCDSDLVEVFLKRSRFPFYNVVRNEGCYTVEWSDAQLMNLGGVHGVTVTVDESGQITHQKLQVKKPVRRRKRRRLVDYLQREAS
ncbi:MAG TPA: metal-dependent hydrolase [Desulfobacteria bacterium]|nr:metal-dependent hydrolase [Desulfobacteria bacterium]